MSPPETEGMQVASKDVKVAGMAGLYHRDGREYVFRKAITTPLGHRQWIRERLGTNDRTEAKVRAGALLKKVAVQGEGRVPKRNQVTVEDFLLNHWVAYLDTRIKLGKLTQTTKDRYLRDVRGKVIPTIGRMRLVDVTVNTAEASWPRCWKKAGPPPRPAPHHAATSPRSTTPPPGCGAAT
jgi:hypothetical protein